MLTAAPLLRYLNTLVLHYAFGYVSAWAPFDTLAWLYRISGVTAAWCLPFLPLSSLLQQSYAMRPAFL